MQRLSPSTLDLLPAAIRRPAFDRCALTTGIVHLGLGAFHRAHQAYYTEGVLEAGDLRWGTLGVSLRSADTRDALAPQEGLYTLSERNHAGESLRIIGGLTGIVVAPENPKGLIARMADPATRIVSLTVTEKGYCHDPATGELNEDHPDIRHDLTSHLTPRSAPGLVVAALAERHRRGRKPFTVLTCDNLPANGQTVRKVLTRLAMLHSPDLGSWVAHEVACPSTVLDRIVPATTDEDRARISATLGIEDAWPVVTEKFTQWVVEDHFPGGRPDWAATFVSDVAPFELMKLRLLNGAHSSLAYLGYLAGRETVADAMADPALAFFVHRLMHEEVFPVLEPPPGADLQAYMAALIERFRNPALRHRTWQIAMDGSQKLPQRLLGTIRERLGRGLPIDGLALGVAAWMRYVTGIDEKGAAIEVSDPMRDELRRRADASGLDASRLAPALLAIDAIFGTDLPSNAVFVSAVRNALHSLITQGAQQTLEHFRKNHA